MTIYQDRNPKSSEFFDEKTGALYLQGTHWINEMTGEEWIYSMTPIGITVWLKKT